MNLLGNEDKSYFEYLDTLRDSGITNMFEAVPYLMNEYPQLSTDEAKKILLDWMNSFSERHKTKRVNLGDILNKIVKESK